MPRTADVTVMMQLSMDIGEDLAELVSAEDLEALRMDMDSVAILLTSFEGRQLTHEDVQWVLWHLLEHVLEDVHGALEGLEDSQKEEEVLNSLDAYIQEFEDKLASRDVAISCPRLDALLTQHWADAEDTRGGDEAPEEEETEEETEE